MSDDKSAATGDGHPTERPAVLTMAIQGGMLEALGINMYTTLGKSLVEFIANAYDGDATFVKIRIPIDEISVARTVIRENAKAQVKDGTRDAFEALLDPLPDALAVTIEDDGHGMSWQDVSEKFLPLNRKRRKENTSGQESRLKSESGKRFVMGRKGLGKLAGFGAAEIVTVRTKRSGSTSTTIVTLDDKRLKTSANVTEVPIPVTYDDAGDVDSHGTMISLTGLKSDAVKEEINDIKQTILEAFAFIRPDDFAIWLNGELLEPVIPDYEFLFPEGLERGQYAASTVEIPEVIEVPFNYYIGFRKRGTHLPARKRGARIYCNNRLAAGPSLFGVRTGMHSFHSADYMECVIEADALDRAGVDFVNTNRSQLKEGNEVVKALLDKISELMEMAIRQHGRFREENSKKEIEADPTAKAVNDIVKTLPSKTRGPAQKLINTFAAEYGVTSAEFRELAPIVVNSVNASEVLIRLIEIQSKPETVERVASLLRDLGEIEKNDALKLYRGRRNGISALQALNEKALDQWGKHRLEKEFHALLKANPWLVRPEFSRCLTSDQDVNKVVSELARELKVDEFATISDDAGDEDATRPDLVFLMGDTSPRGPRTIHIVELKSPTFGLNIDHWRQLEDYIFRVRAWCTAELKAEVQIRGYLIGAMPDTLTASPKQKQLLEKFASEGAEAEIRIVGMKQLLAETQEAHQEAINTLERDLEEEEGPPKPPPGDSSTPELENSD